MSAKPDDGDRPPSFCWNCGQALRQHIHDAHASCAVCERVQYRNPAVGVAVIVRDADGRVLLGRRSRGPYAGQWCFPCGYVEWNEDVRQAALRELQEETGLVAEIGAVFTVHSNFHDRAKQTVGIWFHGRVIDGVLQAGDDIVEVAYFALDALPSLAFPSDELVLRELARE